MATFDLGNIFTSAFGYQPPVASDSVDLKKAAVRKTESKLGFAFYATDMVGREFFLPIYLNGVLIPFAILSMTEKKTIVSTAMPERGGSVKELISIDDYSFNIKGILVSENNDFPDEGMMELHELFKINASITLRSVLSDILLSGKSSDNGNVDPDGHKVVIKELKWPPVSGIEHAKPFEMELESDMIFDLEIQED